jgi:hypothetical protein
MIYLTALFVAVALLYGWLVGNWFARIGMFVSLAIILAYLVGWMADGLAHDDRAFLVGALLGIITAWFIAAVPTYIWRAKARQLLKAQWEGRRIMAQSHSQA